MPFNLPSHRFNLKSKSANLILVAQIDGKQTNMLSLFNRMAFIPSSVLIFGFCFSRGNVCKMFLHDECFLPPVLKYFFWMTQPVVIFYRDWDQSDFAECHSIVRNNWMSEENWIIFNKQSSFCQSELELPRILLSNSPLFVSLL